MEEYWENKDTEPPTYIKISDMTDRELKNNYIVYPCRVLREELMKRNIDLTIYDKN
jgi:hypothetical protein